MPELDDPPPPVVVLVPPVAPGAEDDGVVPPSPAYCCEPADAPDPPNGLRLLEPVPWSPVSGTTPLVAGDDDEFEPPEPPEGEPGLDAVPTESTLPGKSRIVLTFSEVIAATPMAA